jgi:uncharacterized membrane protein YagU involved in acid resistance
MNVGAWALWGFVATIVLTTILSASQGLHLTRMNIPFLLGTMFRPGSRAATRIGFLVHLVNGWIFALVYVAAFHAWHGATWWRGAAIGLVHALFVLAAGMPVLPAFHPHMAMPEQGPTHVAKLEPPGFFAVHYGVRTPVSVLFAHVVYGAILGAFYR